MSRGRLIDPWYEAEFGGNAGPRGSWRRQGADLEGAQLLFLWCPCAYLHDSRAHGLVVPFRNPRNAPVPEHNFGIVARDKKTQPRWEMTGTGLHDLTLTPSVDVGDPSCWHGHITAGAVT
jgi:Family of unknown function (DUF6527)